MSGKVERDAQGRFVRAVGGLVDVTARRRAEDELRQAQKMEAVGQLTGGVAHDFNNLLTVIMGNLELLQNQLDAGRELDRHRLRRLAENAMQGAQRAASLTQRLLAFARRQPLSAQVLDVNNLIREMALLLGRAVGDTVKLDVQLASGLGPVEVDPNQLEASIMNLAINARDAMPSGGVLTITTMEVDLPAGRRAGLPPGEYVLLRVSDSGEGMSEEVRARAFEPFFTTKIVGQGTGLGLSQVYGFVKQSGGHAEIVSALGKGTTISLHLPRAHAEVQAARDSGPRSVVGGAGENILVVEDEEQVRAYAVETLRALNYATREAGDAVTALRMIEDRTKEIDLLLTDVVLPDLDGRQLAQTARGIRPALKVLFMSGYAPAVAPALAGGEDGAGDLIQKPLTRDVLAQRVRTVLDAEWPPQGRIRRAS